MHIHRTDLNLFVVFECIYTTGSVSKAAKALHLTQPTASHALKRLRQRLDDPLFVRNGQKLSPTPVAQNLIGPVRDALRLMEESLTQLDAFTPATATHSFAIGMRPLMEYTYFRTLSRALKVQAPSVELSSVPFQRSNLEADLSSGDLNVAIDVFMPVPGRVRKRLVARAKPVVVARNPHPQLSAGGLSLETYLDMGHVLVSSRARGQGLEDLSLARRGLERKVVTRCQTLATAVDILENTDLLLTIPESYLGRFTNRGQLQTFPAPFTAPDFEIFLYWHENYELSKPSRWLRELIGQTFSQDLE